MRERVVVGRISGVYGVRGWVRVYSYTEPRENILNYTPWHLSHGDETVEVAVAEGKTHGRTMIARIDGIDDRDVAARYIGADIRVARDQFERAPEDEYYWVDLEGMRVETEDGHELGTVAHLFATGANDVLVVEGERRRLIPFVRDEVIRRVDRDAQTIVVDWDPEF